MKRYELAKNAGLNWQAVLIEDLQTDLKLLIMQYVKQRRTFGEINTKVNKMIDDAAKTAESDTIKSMIRNSMPVFASKIYIKAVELYSFRTAPAFIYAFQKLILHYSLFPHVLLSGWRYSPRKATENLGGNITIALCLTEWSRKNINAKLSGE